MQVKEGDTLSVAIRPISSFLYESMTLRRLVLAVSLIGVLEAQENPEEQPVPAPPALPAPVAPAQPVAPETPTPQLPAPVQPTTDSSGRNVLVIDPDEPVAPVAPAAPAAEGIPGEETAVEVIDMSGMDGLPVDENLPISVKINYPRSGTVLDDSTVDLFVKLDNYVLKEGGNRLHIILNNGSPRVHHNASRPITLKNVPEGGNLLRVFAARPDGTSFSDSKSFAVVRFFVRRKDFQNYTDLTRPYLTVNLPEAKEVDVDSQGRVCFDYRVHNAFLSEDEYQIRYRVHGYEGFVKKPGPIYFSNLENGQHTLKVELLNKDGSPTFGIFNNVERVFQVRKPIKALPTGPVDEEFDEVPEEEEIIIQ